VPSDQRQKASEAPMSAPAPDQATSPPKERQRALGPIGCPDLWPKGTLSRETIEEQERRAVANGVIAVRWCSSRYYERCDAVDHPEREQKIYTYRGNWAMEKGLMSVGPDGYTDEITAPAEEPGCRCQWVPIYHTRNLPESMLTARGLAERRKFEAVWAEMKKKHGEPKITLGAAQDSKDKS
jgi:hypothetical protein